ncbi:MAG: chloride channel protein, partial [Bacteroidales bacterium]|nr:chloride channel protein [Bacteroidales bacterium]
LEAVSRNESHIKSHNMWSSMAASAVTIGFGGSVGAEAPIVYTGAAIGSNLARLAKFSYANITVLLGCGAAGAIAGIFKAPLAGILFTMEILMFNLSMASLLPLLLSAMSATVVSYIFTGQTAMFHCTLTPFSMQNIPFYILMGMLCGVGSVFFMNATLGLEDKLGRMKNPYGRWALCALGLGILIFLFPVLYGEGYTSIISLLNGHVLEIDTQTPLSFMLDSPWGVPLFFLLVFLVKVLAMTFTNVGGGVGGTFGPTLFVGAILGFVIARSLNLLFATRGITVPEQNFVLVGMAAMMAGVMQAPLTAIFLIAEITGGYELFLPLIIAATISFGTTRLFEKYSIYTKRIAQAGDLLTHDSDQAVLTLLKTSDLVRDKYPRIAPDASLRNLVGVISGSNAALVAVVDERGVFQGLVNIEDIRKLLFDESKYDSLKVYNLMVQPPTYVKMDEKMDSVMAKFDKTGAWRLPVVDSEKRYKGFVSRSRILTAYREELKEISRA